MPRDSAAELAYAPPGARLLTVALAALAVAFAIDVGLAAGNPAPGILMPALLLVGITAVLTALTQNFAAFLVLAASPIFLISVLVAGNRGLNAFDVLMPPLLLAYVFGDSRNRARAEDLRWTDPPHREITAASRRLGQAVAAFYLIAALSIVVMILGGRGAAAPNSLFSLVRAVQGVLLFPIGIWLFRTEERIHAAIRAMLVAGVLVVIANAVALGTHAIERAGQTWIINQPDKPIDDPNAAPSAMLLLIVLLLVRQTMRHRLRNVFLIGVAGAMLVMTASRSGLLACLTFTMLVLPRARLRWVLLTALAVIAALPLIPEHYWTRLAKTLTLQRGTFEAYTSIIRFHAWKVALAMFRDHPWFGVGYVGISTLSAQYGELRMHFGTAENFYLETAAGMGIPGLIAFVFVLVRLFQMGRVVHRCAPSGTLARAMAQFHAPMIVALLVICITGNQFGGVAPTGQLALWLAMMVRASHLAIEAARPPTGRPALGSGVR